jgi:uncharacterized protein YgbK (DUF1537 family)
MWQNIYVLADDLTGLAETMQAIVQPLVLNGRHYQNHVYPIAPANTFPLVQPYTVIGINTEERSYLNAPPFLRGITTQHHFSRTFLYQKMDSTLRGWWANSAQAWFTAPQPVALVWCCPAYPQQGRTTVNGLHYLNQQLLNQTALAQDPCFPIQTPQLLDYLAAVGVCANEIYSMTVEAIDQYTVAEWVSILTQVFHQSNPPRWIVQDATTPEQLHKMAEVVQQLQQQALLPQTLFLGCAGWANALAHHISPCLEPTNTSSTVTNLTDLKSVAMLDQPTVEKPRLKLLLSGSVNPVTLKQLATLRTTATAFPQRWVSCWGGENQSLRSVSAILQACQQLQPDTLLLLTTCSHITERTTQLQQQTAVWETLQQVLQALFAQYTFQLVICCGGETSLLALKIANPTQLTSNYQHCNTPFPTFYDTTGCAWVFKSGNMGDDTTLQSLLQ